MLSSGVYTSLGAGFTFNKKQLIDGRQEYSTIADMAKAKDLQMPEMVIGFCHEDHNVYVFNKQNPKDDVLGKWRPLSVDVELNVKFEDVNVEDADIDVLYVVGESIRYTYDNAAWTYLNQSLLAGVTFETLHDYTIGDIIVRNNKLYHCVVPYTSSTDFDTDLSNGYWSIMNIMFNGGEIV